jgi:hypothetical protein
VDHDLLVRRILEERIVAARDRHAALEEAVDDVAPVDDLLLVSLRESASVEPDDDRRGFVAPGLPEVQDVALVPGVVLLVGPVGAGAAAGNELAERAPGAATRKARRRALFMGPFSNGIGTEGPRKEFA